MYSDESKREALKLMKNGAKVVVVAKTTLISRSTLYRWKKELAKKYTIINKNKLIGNLIFQYQKELIVEKDKANDTMQKIMGLIEECFELEPNNMYTFSYAVKAAKLRKDIPEAISLLERRLELEPGNIIAIEELERLQQKQKEEKFRQEELERIEFLDAYNRLKGNKNIEELETLLRNRFLKYPNDLILQNQLASVLLDKLSKNPNNHDLILEIKNILLKLHELSPNNLTVKSNLIRLEKICCNEKNMEVMLRELIATDSENYKAKSQLAQLLINKCKSEAKVHKLEEDSLNEATSLANQVLQKFPDNHYALGQLIEIAKLKRDLKTEEILLRKSVKLDPSNLKLKTSLAGTMIEQCIQKVLKDGMIVQYDPQLIEAKQILLEIHELQPKNLYVITYLIRVANLQSHIREAISLLRLKITIDPTDIQSKEYLHTLEEKVRLKSGKRAESTEKEAIDEDLTDYFVSPNIETTVPADTQIKVVSKPLITLYSELMKALDDGWDRQLVSGILNKMLEDESISDDDKRKLHVMIEKTKSSKQKTRFSLREQAIIFSRRLR